MVPSATSTLMVSPAWACVVEVTVRLPIRAIANPSRMMCTGERLSVSSPRASILLRSLSSALTAESLSVEARVRRRMPC